ncbi:hypothetical protein [Marininema halotolerans]|uniref:Uncharacterized protein n=1 Tax=Marininema halotolerans TaxID=1155944 RepID=A0A1I6UK51_9BACL|nr:hypothetical protein [Marininema halotolerans]SFT01800.1 hypothetical protein SAMN05444972_11729 [Marininema halotolerans]
MDKISVKLVGSGGDWRVEEMYLRPQEFQKIEGEKEDTIITEFHTFEEVYNDYYEEAIQLGKVAGGWREIPTPKTINELNGIAYDYDDNYTSIIVDGKVIRRTNGDDLLNFLEDV